MRLWYPRASSMIWVEFKWPSCSERTAKIARREAVNRNPLAERTSSPQEEGFSRSGVMENLSCD